MIADAGSFGRYRSRLALRPLILAKAVPIASRRWIALATVPMISIGKLLLPISAHTEPEIVEGCPFSRESLRGFPIISST
jgi:hypothetical protein